MEKILFLAHTELDGTVAKSVLETLPAAQALGNELIVGLIGGLGLLQPAANQLAACGATRFLAVEGEAFTQSRYATDAAAAEALCRAAGATVILAPHTSRWSRALPGVAGRLSGPIDTHATAVAIVDGAPAVTRWFYRQRMEGVLTRSARPWFILVEGGGYPAYAGPIGTAAVERIPTPEVATRTTVTGIRAPKADEQTIRPEANLLFVAGAGWTKKQADGAIHAQEAEQLILGMLHASKASLGGSKSLVDSSGEGEAVLKCMTHLNQVGQTGATPRHPKGLSTCCHGEEPHVVGWRFITERRAINLDANCGWAHGKADVVYIADAFEVMRHVNRMLEATPA
jgi:electron transfer flavoprotein alpha subunit